MSDYTKGLGLNPEKKPMPRWVWWLLEAAILAGLLGGLLLVSGCQSHSGNFAQQDKNLPYDKGNAVTTKTLEYIGVDGKTIIAQKETVEETPMAVNKKIVIEQLRDSRDAYIGHTGGGGFVDVRSAGYWSNGVWVSTAARTSSASASADVAARTEQWQRQQYGGGGYAIGGTTVH